MNALEHIAFVLSSAVEADEVSKAEMLRILSEVNTASYETGEAGDTEALQKLSAKLGRRYKHLIHPDGIHEGEE